MAYISQNHARREEVSSWEVLLAIAEPAADSHDALSWFGCARAWRCACSDAMIARPAAESALIVVVRGVPPSMNAPNSYSPTNAHVNATPMTKYCTVGHINQSLCVSGATNIQPQHAIRSKLTLMSTLATPGFGRPSISRAQRWGAFGLDSGWRIGGLVSLLGVGAALAIWRAGGILLTP